MRLPDRTDLLAIGGCGGLCVELRPECRQPQRDHPA